MANNFNGRKKNTNLKLANLKQAEFLTEWIKKVATEQQWYVEHLRKRVKELQAEVNNENTARAANPVGSDGRIAD